MSVPSVDARPAIRPTEAEQVLRVSVIVPVRNERSRLPAVLAGIEGQTQPPDEVIFADGMSSDGTRDWLAGAARSRPWLTVVDNPARVVPAALNAALRAASGDLVARMDAHADYSPDYLRSLACLLAERRDVVGVGGAMRTAGRGPWGLAIAATLRRGVGMGGAEHRRGAAAGPVPHVFTGCYRREALIEAGGYDERLLANEDFEMDVRLQQQGALIWLDPSAHSTWYVRSSLTGLARQMWRYGHYKALTLWLHPRSLKARQLAPPLVMVSLLVTLVSRPRVGACATGAYLACSATAGARAASQDGAAWWRGALAPPVVHLSWGAGLLTGLPRFAAVTLRDREGPHGGLRLPPGARRRGPSQSTKQRVRRSGEDETVSPPPDCQPVRRPETPR